jgi:serine/threonine-protein phosphatase 5
MKEQGYEVEADGRVVTIFSAPNYCDQMGNKGAFIRLQGRDCSLRYEQFVAVVSASQPHPNVPTMAYARQFF